MNGKKAKMRNGKKKNGKLTIHYNFVNLSFEHNFPIVELISCQ